MTTDTKRKMRASVRRAEQLSRKFHDACADANSWVATYHDGDAGLMSQRLREASKLTRGLALDLRLKFQSEVAK